jgi:tetratricopeptide (TPR) repeat protein
MGNLSAAVKTLETAVQRNPTAPALNNLGSVYANRGEMQRAIQAFQTAVRVDPSFQPARQNLERALAGAGNRPLLVPQCFNRIERCGLVCRIVAKEHSSRR